jgi:cell division protein FtsB
MRPIPKKSKANENYGTSRYAALAIVASIAFMLCLTINYRAFSEMSREADENQNLSWQIQNLTEENLALQEQIHNLKTDTDSIRREARRLGLTDRTNEVPVPANK